MEFIPASEAASVLEDHGLLSESTDEDHTYVRMRSGETVQHHRLMLEGCDVEPREGVEVFNIPPDRLSSVVDDVLTNCSLHPCSNTIRNYLCKVI